MGETLKLLFDLRLFLYWEQTKERNNEHSKKCKSFRYRHVTTWEDEVEISFSGDWQWIGTKPVSEIFLEFNLLNGRVGSISRSSNGWLVWAVYDLNSKLSLIECELPSSNPGTRHVWPSSFQHSEDAAAAAVTTSCNGVILTGLDPAVLIYTLERLHSHECDDDNDTCKQ